ncbi:glutaredoxin family protein [Bacillus kwashiorkori]|uniref:glutaredoxin family protein n=1 Tax=Bacillus kwashiorkori TaxID=1522318 RepID=UPI0007825823|nr:glutaredoxin family protein [Bacillus kwashiorkori]
MTQEIILYMRKNCHLCDDAKNILLELANDFAFKITEIDIDCEDLLVEKYGLIIPVIMLNGEVIQYGQIVKERLSKRLQEKNILKIG